MSIVHILREFFDFSNQMHHFNDSLSFQSIVYFLQHFVYERQLAYLSWLLLNLWHIRFFISAANGRKCFIAFVKDIGTSSMTGFVGEKI